MIETDAVTESAPETPIDESECMRAGFWAHLVGVLLGIALLLVTLLAISSHELTTVAQRDNAFFHFCRTLFVGIPVAVLMGIAAGWLTFHFGFKHDVMGGDAGATFPTTFFLFCSLSRGCRRFLWPMTILAVALAEA